MTNGKKIEMPALDAFVRDWERAKREFLKSRVFWIFSRKFYWPNW